MMTDKDLVHIEKGRNNKGIIFVKSAGNDKDIGDNCAVDGDMNNVFLITIAGAHQWGKPAYCSERCTAIFATTYTRSHYTEGIVAPRLNGACYADFSGTSAAVPQASGIFALVLEANPDLTYRDVMHLVTISAEVAPLADNDDTWYKNGRGFWVSNDFGFGLMNAENMVNLAKDWVNVPNKTDCIDTVLIDPAERLAHRFHVSVTFKTSACKGTPNEVNYLEHVELASLVSYPYRGYISVYLTSPAGTTSNLLEPRYKDNDPDGLEGWSIMSTHNWGEDPRGEWTVMYIITNKRRSTEYGYVREFTLRFHRTKDMPAHYARKRRYAAFRLPDGRASE